MNKEKGCNEVLAYEDIPSHKCDIYCETCTIGFKMSKHDCLGLMRAEIERLRQSEANQCNPSTNLFTLLGEDLLIARNPRFKCMKNHELALVNRSCHWFCNWCSQKFKMGEAAWGCKLCDYDLCVICLPFEFEKTHRTEG